MKTEKRHVGRPATGTTKISVNISLSFSADEKLSKLAHESNTTRSAIIERLIEDAK